MERNGTGSASGATEEFTALHGVSLGGRAKQLASYIDVWERYLAI